MKPTLSSIQEAAYKALEGKTLREVFKQVQQHLLTQGMQSKGEDASGIVRCMYRGPEELKCAVGCLIADEDYRPSMEGEYIYPCHEFQNIDELGPELEINSEAQYLYMLSRLQAVHDTVAPDQWQTELERLEQHLFTVKGFE